MANGKIWWQKISPRFLGKLTILISYFPSTIPQLQTIVEAKTQHPVPDNRSDSFSRTPHFHVKSEGALNEQINIEYNMSYIYHAMYAYFARDNVYLPGIAAHFLKECLEERDHAELLMNYQIKRGGRVELQSIMPPQVDYDHPEKGDALYAFELSLSLEKLNNDRLIALHRVAGEADDANMQDFIEGELLADQVKSIEEVSRFVGQLRRVGNKGDAVWHFDQALLKARESFCFFRRTEKKGLWCFAIVRLKELHVKINELMKELIHHHHHHHQTPQLYHHQTPHHNHR